MERLTFDGNFCDISQCRELPCSYNGSCSQRKVWERLKAYEDTHMMPADVMSMRMDMAILTGLFDGIDVDRMREIVAAERDGRLVVLPCKVGDVMYKLFREYTECTSYQVRKDNYCCEGCMVPCDSREVTVIRAIQPNSLPEVVRYIEDIGKTVFLTREEAKAALEAMKDE